MESDFAALEGWIWQDGAMVRAGDARLHVLSHALHFAGAVFEGVRVYDGRPFALTAHLERLARSAAILGYGLPFAIADLEAACHATIAAQKLGDGYLRPLAWRGSQSVSVPAAGTRVHVALAAFAWPSYYGTRRGLELGIARWRRPSPRTAPVHSKTSGLYTIATMARDEATAAGLDDALMLDWRGYIAEATGANLFLLIDGALHTPIADCFLDGITRRTVIALAGSRGIEVVERHIRPREIASAKAAFLSGTAVEIAPIAAIGRHRLDARSAPVEAIAADYAELVRAATPALSGSAAPRSADRRPDRPAGGLPSCLPAWPP